MNSKAGRRPKVRDQGLAEPILPLLPPPQLIEQAKAIRDLYSQWQTTLEKLRAAEQAHRNTHRALTEAGSKPSDNSSLADAIEARLKTEATLVEAETSIVETRRQLVAIEAQVHELEDPFCIAVADFYRPLLARAAENIRAAARPLRKARDEYHAIGHIICEPNRTLTIRVTDPENGFDLMYTHETEWPDFLRECLTIRQALREAATCYSGAKGIRRAGEP
jgi:hypothetical protein